MINEMYETTNGMNLINEKEVEEKIAVPILLGIPKVVVICPLIGPFLTFWLYKYVCVLLLFVLVQDRTAAAASSSSRLVRMKRGGDTKRSSPLAVSEKARENAVLKRKMKKVLPCFFCFCFI